MTPKNARAASNLKHEAGLPGSAGPWARGAALAAAVAALLAASPATADKIYLKNKKVLDGIVQEEYATSVMFLYQGRVTKIPKDRIDKIAKESGGSNIDMLIDNAEKALKSGDAEQADTYLNKAIEINGPTGEHADKLGALEAQVVKLRAMGSPDERRKQAQKLLEEAISNFDKIETQKGTELLLKALDVDPNYEPAHDQMALFMRNNMTNFTSNPIFRNMAKEYFVNQVNVDTIKVDHPLGNLLPLLYQEEQKGLVGSEDPADVSKRVLRLKKMSAAFDKHPEWLKFADDAQKAMIQKKGSGVITEQVESLLKEGRYDQAMARLQALGKEDEADLRDLYTRTYIGLQKFDKAKDLLEASRAGSKDPESIDRAKNALDQFAKAVEAMNAGNHKDARSILSRLFELRQELYPEIYQMVAKSKVSYDITEMEALEGAGDNEGAANIAIRIFQYASATDKNSRKTAEETFNRLAPQLAFKPKVVWIVDDIAVPLPEDYNKVVGDVAKVRFPTLKLADASPFVMEFRILMTTFNQAGQRVSDAAQKPQAFEIDQLEPDTGATSIKIEVVISHAENPKLAQVEQEYKTMPDAVKKSREAHPELGSKDSPILITIGKVADIRPFIDRELGIYLPAGAGDLAKLLKLKS